MLITMCNMRMDMLNIMALGGLKYIDQHSDWVWSHLKQWVYTCSPLLTPFLSLPSGLYAVQHQAVCIAMEVLEE